MGFGDARVVRVGAGVGVGVGVGVGLGGDVVGKGGATDATVGLDAHAATRATATTPSTAAMPFATTGRPRGRAYLLLIGAERTAAYCAADVG